MALCAALCVACGDDGMEMPSADGGTCAPGSCDDGIYCNGVELCVEGACQPGTPPCAAAACDEASDRCDETTCEDGDGDGYPAASCGGTDCDDANREVFPGAPERCDDVDDDCDPATLGADRDGDGYVSFDCSNAGVAGGDCNDDSMEVNPEATEICNGRDDDCDGDLDEGVLTTYWADVDGDGDGDPDAETQLCTIAEGWSNTRTDCDDDDATTYEAAPEFCDGLDQDCSDGGGAAPDEDVDGDGFVAEGDSCIGCPAGAGSTCETQRDCNDDLAQAFPGQTEFVAPDCGAIVDYCIGVGWCGELLDGGTCGLSVPPTAPFVDFDCDGTPEPQPAVSGTCRSTLVTDPGTGSVYGACRFVNSSSGVPVTTGAFGPDATDPRASDAECGDKVDYRFCEDVDPGSGIDCQERTEADAYRYCR